MILKPNDIRRGSHVVVLGGYRHMDNGRKVLKKVKVDAQNVSEIAEYISGRYNNTTYYILGIFPNLSPNRRTLTWHERNAIHTRKGHDLLGWPEGCEVERGYNGKGVRVYKTRYNVARGTYQTKLKTILKKAKELIELGIDKKAAFAAARKCGCHT